MDHPRAACYTRCQTACRADEERQISMEEEKKTKTPCDVMIKKKNPKKLMVEGSLKKMIRPLQTVRNISISPQPNDYTACWKCEKPAQVQKKNNLLSVALIHFHSERQYLVLDRVCWYGLTEDSDAGTEQILYTFRSA